MIVSRLTHREPTSPNQRKRGKARAGQTVFRAISISRPSEEEQWRIKTIPLTVPLLIKLLIRHAIRRNEIVVREPRRSQDDARRLPVAAGRWCGEHLPDTPECQTAEVNMQNHPLSASTREHCITCARFKALKSGSSDDAILRRKWFRDKIMEERGKGIR